MEREDFEKIIVDQAIAAGNRIKYMKLENNLLIELFHL